MAERFRLSEAHQSLKAWAKHAGYDSGGQARIRALQERTAEMRTLQRLVSVLAGIIAAVSIVTPVHAQESIAIAGRFAEVNGTRLRYLIAGKGEPVLLLHGYAQTSHMWRPLIAELAKTHTVIAPDLRGFGGSAKPEGGYDKRTMAQDVHALATTLGYKRVGIAGHDIGLMVAYAYAAQFPIKVERIALMDAFLP